MPHQHVERKTGLSAGRRGGEWVGHWHTSTDNTRVKVESAFFYYNYPLFTVLSLLQYIPVPTMVGISSAPIPFLRLES
jgi:hypothetical protein